MTEARGSSSAPNLSDGVVSLRAWRDDDVAAQLAAWSDPHFRRFSDWAPTTPDEALARLTTQRRSQAQGMAAAFAICPAGDLDDVLGEVTLHQVDKVHHTASIGYWLSPAARGRGATTRAVRLATRWGVAALGVARFELTCAPDNDASAAVAARAGFTFEGRLRSNVTFRDRPRDSLVFSLLASDSGARAAADLSEPGQSNLR